VPPSQYPDLPDNNTPPETPSVPPVQFSWTGIYVGVHGGATNTTTTRNASCQDNPGPFTYTSSCLGDSFGPLFQQGSLDFSNIHAGGGVQAGGRVQFGILVVGIDIDVTRLSGSDKETYVAFDTEFGFDTTVEQQMRWFGTTRATAGIAFGNILIFVTGGVAVGDVEYGVGVQNYATEFQSVVQVGYVAGGGFEIGLGLISFRGEFLHFDLGDETVVNGMDGNAITTSQFQNTGDTFRFAINFRLN
jgi:outer membrane immunogenic protein